MEDKEQFKMTVIEKVEPKELWAVKDFYSRFKMIVHDEVVSKDVWVLTDSYRRLKTKLYPRKFEF